MCAQSTDPSSQFRYWNKTKGRQKKRKMVKQQLAHTEPPNDRGRPAHSGANILRCTHRTIVKDLENHYEMQLSFNENQPQILQAHTHMRTAHSISSFFFCAYPYSLSTISIFFILQFFAFMSARSALMDGQKKKKKKIVWGNAQVGSSKRAKLFWSSHAHVSPSLLRSLSSTTSRGCLFVITLPSK